MRLILAALFLVHGLIHLMGFAKAFGYAELPQLTQPISRPMGLLWLLGAALLTGSGVLIVAWPRVWWVVGAAALVLSQVAILSAWRDAWAGTIANVVLLVAVVHAWSNR